MDSKVARDSRRALIAATLRLTPEERLHAFLQQCKLMAALHRAGQTQSSERQPGP